MKQNKKKMYSIDVFVDKRIAANIALPAMNEEEAQKLAADLITYKVSEHKTITVE